MREPLAIIAKTAGIGGATNLYYCLKQHSKRFNPTLVVHKRTFTNHLPSDVPLFEEDKDYYEDKILKSKYIIFASTVDFRDMIRYGKYISGNKKEARGLVSSKKTALFLGRSEYRRQYKWYNSRMKKTMTIPIVMPHYRSFVSDGLPLIQPMDPINATRDDIITISHSPAALSSAKLFKGKDVRNSKQIVKIINVLKKSYKFKFDLIVGSTWKECIKRKSKSHIVIDSINKYGIGKSGIEGIAAGCVVIASPRDEHYIDSYYPKPPVFKVLSPKFLKKILTKLLGDKKYLYSRMEMTRKYRKYISLQSTADYLDSNLWLEQE